jgi:thiopeptide-type bacteriocin biosynthesis protein
MNQRTFICGSEWLYFKIYSGPKTIENVLVNEIYPLIKQLMEQKIIDKFFFIRYTDPNYHIRLRLHFENTDNIIIVLKTLSQILNEYITDHVISRVTIDTYNREIERYRKHFIIDIEHLFFFDSIFVLDYLCAYPECEQEKWLVSIKYVDLLMSECGLLLTDKINFCQQMYDALLTDTGLKNKYTNERLKLKYRSNSRIIKNILNEDMAVAKFAWIEGLKNYLAKIRFFTQKLREENQSEIFNILSSIIHMHINRLFRTKQRLDECVIYHLLLKHYHSIVNFSKHNINA